MTTSISPTSSSSPLALRLASVRSDIAAAARAVGRVPEEVTTIVVTKFHPAELVRELVRLGVTDVGENRHQEAQDKAAELSGLGVRWHFVGQLQSKKARHVRRYAQVIHSVDRLSLVDALTRGEAATEAAVEVFVQLNLTDDLDRGGVVDRDLEPLVEHVLAAPGLRLLGVMAVAPLDEDPKRAFDRVRRASERVQGLAPGAVAISAGMSQDYREAIAAGATHLRIGTAITGNRPIFR